MKKFPILLVFLFLVGCTSLKSLPANDLQGSIEIHDIQGCQHRSPYENHTVENIRGVVTWKVENGFYFQSTSPDNKDCSSEGIFVFTSSYPQVVPGDEVSVNGKVEEFTPGSENDNNLSVTEINTTGYKILSSGNDLPAAQEVGKSLPGDIIEDDSFDLFDPSTDGLDYWESLEGMLVEVKNARVVAPRNSYGEIVVISGDGASNNVLSKEGALVATENDLNPERVFVELPKSFKKDINLGAQFTSPIIGVLGYEYGNYRILEQNSPEFNKLEIKPAKLDPVIPSGMRVATYNLENWSRFDKDRTQQFASDIVTWLASPDVLMLQEVQDDSGSEDNGETAAKKNILALIEAVQEKNGPEYAYFEVDPIDGTSGGLSGANIRTVMLYRTDRIKLIKGYKLTDLGIERSQYKGVREPLIAKVEFEGHEVIFIGIHLVSNNLNTPLFGAIQPIEKPEEEKRIQQAQNIVQLAKILRNKNPLATLIVLGDLNDVPNSNTLLQFVEAGFEDPFDNFPSSERYSVIFEGNAQQFDQILLKKAADCQILDSMIVHLNTGISERNQTSDHDPVLIDLGF
jgi:predicted extracellular nuclease